MQERFSQVDLQKHANAFLNEMSKVLYNEENKEIIPKKFDEGFCNGLTLLEIRSCFIKKEDKFLEKLNWLKEKNNSKSLGLLYGTYLKYRHEADNKKEKMTKEAILEKMLKEHLKKETLSKEELTKLDTLKIRLEQAESIYAMINAILLMQYPGGIPYQNQEPLLNDIEEFLKKREWHKKQLFLYENILEPKSKTIISEPIIMSQESNIKKIIKVVSMDEDYKSIDEYYNITQVGAVTTEQDTQDILSRLKDNDIIKITVVNRISHSGHTVSVQKKGEDFYLFDSNNIQIAENPLDTIECAKKIRQFLHGDFVTAKHPKYKDAPPLDENTVLPTTFNILSQHPDPALGKEIHEKLKANDKNYLDRSGWDGTRARDIALRYSDSSTVNDLAADKINHTSFWEKFNSKKIFKKVAAAEQHDALRSHFPLGKMLAATTGIGALAGGIITTIGIITAGTSIIASLPIIAGVTALTGLFGAISWGFTYWETREDTKPLIQTHLDEISPEMMKKLTHTEKSKEFDKKDLSIYEKLSIQPSPSSSEKKESEPIYSSPLHMLKKPPKKNLDLEQPLIEKEKKSPEKKS